MALECWFFSVTPGLSSVLKKKQAFSMLFMSENVKQAGSSFTSYLIVFLTNLLHRLRRLLNGALQKLREYEAREREPEINTAGDMTSSCSEGASEADKLTAKVSSGFCRILWFLFLSVNVHTSVILFYAPSCIVRCLFSP